MIRGAAIAFAALASCSRAADPAFTDGATDSDAAEAETCFPTDAAGYAPAAWIPPHPRMHACSDTDLTDYVHDCIDGATAIPIRCSQFRAERAACAECIFPKDTSGGAGVFLPRKGIVELNVGGCIALALADSGPEGCGAREQAARECVAFVCADCETGCVAQARAGPCAKEQLRTCPELAVAATCALDRGLADDVLRVGRVLCGL